MVFLWVLLWIVLGLLLLLVAALFVPVELALEADTRRRPRLDIRMVWLFGLVRLDLRKRRPRRAVEPRKVSGAKPRRPQAEQLKDMLEMVRTRGLLRHIVRLIKRLFRAIRIRDFAAELRVGLGDPADTGMLFAVIGPLTPLLSYYRFDLQPVQADDPVIEGYSRGRVSVQPIRVIVAALAFIFSPGVPNHEAGGGAKMATLRLAVEEPLRCGPVTIVAVSRVWTGRWQGRWGLSSFGSKSPVAVIVEEGSRRRVLRLTGEEISIEEFGREAPELRADLEKLGR